MRKIRVAVTKIAAWMIGEVALDDGVDHQLADARPAEDGLDDHGPVDDAGRLVAGDGDHRQHGVAQRVDEDDRAARGCPWPAPS